MIGSLSKSGGALVACLAKDPSLWIAGTPPLRDIVQDGGFTAQTGMDVWRLLGLALLVLRPVLLNVPSMCTVHGENERMASLSVLRRRLSCLLCSRRDPSAIESFVTASKYFVMSP